MSDQNTEQVDIEITHEHPIQNQHFQFDDDDEMLLAPPTIWTRIKERFDKKQITQTAVLVCLVLVFVFGLLGIILIITAVQCMDIYFQLTS